MSPPAGNKHRRHLIPEPRRTGYRYAFFGAAGFNAVYGLAMLLVPHLWLRVAQYPADPANTTATIFWQGIGLFVLLYAMLYWFAAREPERFAPIILVATIGKVLGLLGFLNAWLIEGVVSGRVGFSAFFTDLIWLPVFMPFVYETSIQRRYEPR